MASHTQKGSVSLLAFQWTQGATIASVVAANPQETWIRSLPFHTPGDGTLHVPTWQGTTRANPTDWVIKNPDGTVQVLTNSQFTTLYS